MDIISFEASQVHNGIVSFVSYVQFCLHPLALMHFQFCPILGVILYLQIHQQYLQQFHGKLFHCLHEFNLLHLLFAYNCFSSELCIQVPHEKPQRGVAMVNQHPHQYLHFLERDLLVAIFNLDSKTLIQSQNEIFTMIRSNLKENSGFLPQYQCGCWCTQCKGRETIALSHGSLQGIAKKSRLCYGPE